MKVSDNDLTHTQNCQHRLKIVCPDEILKTWVIDKAKSESLVS